MNSSLNTNKKNNLNTIILDNIHIEIIYKDIKHIYLKNQHTTGKIIISAPQHTDYNYIKTFIISRLDWIKKQQNKLTQHPHLNSIKYTTKEKHYYLGKSYSLNVIEHLAPPEILLKGSSLEMYIKPNSTIINRQAILENWYRQKLQEIIPALIIKYEKIMNVKVNEFRIKKMKTKWGTCNINKKRIWINLELAKRTKEHIEYIVVHEMVHLLEKGHNKRFKNFMTQFLPNWELYKRELNKAQ